MNRIDEVMQFKRFLDNASYRFDNLNHYLDFSKKIIEFNKTHNNVELRNWFDLNTMTIYVDARCKKARGDKWVVIGSKYLRGLVLESKSRKYVNLKNLTEKNRNELKSFVPELEQYFRGQKEVVE